MKEKDETGARVDQGADPEDEEEDAASFLDYADLDVQQVKVEAPSQVPAPTDDEDPPVTAKKMEPLDHLAEGEDQSANLEPPAHLPREKKKTKDISKKMPAIDHGTIEHFSNEQETKKEPDKYDLKIKQIEEKMKKRKEE